MGAMNARIIGSGEQTLILSHGFGGSQYVWEKMLPNLSQRYTVAVFDWIFSGFVDPTTAVEPSKFSFFDSFADDLISLVDKMNLGGAVFVGHSMAGMIGCIASVKRPGLFSQIVLIGASPRYLNAEDYEGGLETADVEKILSGIESDFPAWARSFASLVVGANDPIAVEKLRMSMLAMRPEVALAVARTIFLSDFRDLLGRVETPCTIVQGTNDFVVPVSVGRYMQRRLKARATLEIIEEDGHVPQLTAHQLLVELLDRVLSSNT